MEIRRMRCTSGIPLSGPGNSNRFVPVILVMVVLGIGIAFGVATAEAVTVTVPATGNPWLAGMPDGSTACCGDTAPAQSPTEVLGLPLTPGAMLTFSATGATDHCIGGGCGLAGPEGDFGEGAYIHGAENGLSGVTALIDALMGVFVGPAAPNTTSPTPPDLSFGTAAERDFATLAPLLEQVFFIGDGRRNDGVTVQTFVVPTGATRLFLGPMNGCCWNDNFGSLTVTATVPEPASVLLLGLGLAGLAAARSRRRGTR